MDDCCGIHTVAGGTFSRSFDDAGFTDAGSAATVSPFRLDTFEVTVGRFRNFVNAVTSTDGGLLEAGAGKHAQLRDGGGVIDPSTGAFETGWDPAWNSALQSADWDANLACDLSYHAFTWYSVTSQNESKPINCINWLEAYAFCAWDHGYLPTEAEWNFAAAGGSDQRIYPWGSEDPGISSDFAVYDCLYGGNRPGNCTIGLYANIGQVGSPALGYGKWGQGDLAGNVAEWNLDWFAPYATPCVDCAALSGGTQRVTRGGSFMSAAAYLAASQRLGTDPSYRSTTVGIRCARAP
jgi:formylglycine-generating enzyme required for sulfatase activity